MKHTNIQQQAFQPQRKRVRKHSHPTPQNKPQPPAESSLDLLTKTALVLLGLMALLAIVPMEWLP